MEDKILNLVRGKSLLAPADLEIAKVIIPSKIVKETKKQLLSFSRGKEHFEGVVYWAGKENKKGLLVTKVMVPKALATPVSFQVKALENARIASVLVKESLQIIAQVQTRPWGADVTCSILDEEVGFMPHEGLVLIIVRDYATKGIIPLIEQAGVYVFRQGSFLRLSGEQVIKFFKLTS